MSLILLRNVCKSYGEKLLFENVNLNINSEDKVGLIGKNGAGKTTLIKIMLGLEGSSGEIIAEKFEYSYFKQIEDLNPEELTLKFVLEKDIYDSAKVESVNQFCRGLGLDCSLLYRNVGTLSGGEKAKIFIIKSILNNPDLIILDEPTNHLDIFGKKFLEDWIKKSNKTFLIVSHDRDFLGNVTDKIFELENNLIKSYPMGFSEYVEFKEKELEERWKNFEENFKEHKKIKENALQKIGWSVKATTKERKLRKEKGTKDPGVVSKINKLMKSQGRLASEAKRMREKADKLDLSKPFVNNEKINVDFLKLKKSYNEVLSVKDLSKSIDKKLLFNSLDLDVKRGDKIIIMGKNGIGKTTFLEIINDVLKQDTGDCILGSDVNMGYCKQNKSLPKNSTLLGYLLDNHKQIDKFTMQNYLAKFLFRNKDITKEIGQLSGGELIRLDLLDKLLSGANFLLLDEPTNNLDLNSVNVLEQFLKDFSGTLLIISHDTQLIRNVATQVYELTQEGLVHKSIS